MRTAKKTLKADFDQLAERLAQAAPCLTEEEKQAAALLFFGTDKIENTLKAALRAQVAFGLTAARGVYLSAGERQERKEEYFRTYGEELSFWLPKTDGVVHSLAGVLMEPVNALKESKYARRDEKETEQRKQARLDAARPKLARFMTAA